MGDRVGQGQLCRTDHSGSLPDCNEGLICMALEEFAFLRIGRCEVMEGGLN